MRIAIMQADFVRRAYSSLAKDGRVRTFENDGSWAWSVFPIRFRSEGELMRFAEISSSMGLSGKRYYFSSMKNGYTGATNILSVSNLYQSNAWSLQTYCLPTYGQFTESEIQEISETIDTTLKQL